MLDAPKFRIEELFKTLTEATPLLNAQTEKSVSLAASIQFPLPYLRVLAEVRCIPLTHSCLLQSIAASPSGYTGSHIEKVGVGFTYTTAISLSGCRSDHNIRPHVGERDEPSWFRPMGDTIAPQDARCRGHNLVVPIHSARSARNLWAHKQMIAIRINNGSVATESTANA